MREMRAIFENGELLGLEIDGRRCMRPKGVSRKYWRYEFGFDEKGMTVVWIGADEVLKSWGSGQSVGVGETRFNSVYE